MNKFDSVTVKKIKRYGGRIIKSPEFRAGFDQTHHYISSVSDHTLNVTIKALKISHKLRVFGFRPDERVIVKASLLHDLGIIGRYEKYKNNSECGKKHPGDSVKIARKMLKKLDDRTGDAIRYHMWPLGGRLPKYIEGMIIIAADKWCPPAEWIWHLSGRVWYEEIKKELCPEFY